MKLELICSLKLEIIHNCLRIGKCRSIVSLLIFMNTELLYLIKKFSPMSYNFQNIFNFLFFFILNYSDRLRIINIIQKNISTHFVMERVEKQYQFQLIVKTATQEESIYSLSSQKTLFYYDLAC